MPKVTRAYMLAPSRMTATMRNVAVGEELGVKVKFQSIDWDAKEMELKSKKIDCIWNGMSATEERQKSIFHTCLYNRIYDICKNGK